MAVFCSNGPVFCPSGGCPDTVIVGGERLPAGCARRLGWTPAMGRSYPVSLAAATAVAESR